MYGVKLLKPLARDRRDGMSREGSGRVAVLKATGLVRSYTLECNYNTGRLVNVLPPAVRDTPLPTAPSAGIPPKYTPHIFEEVNPFQVQVSNWLVYTNQTTVDRPGKICLQVYHCHISKSKTGSRPSTNNKKKHSIRKSRSKSWIAINFCPKIRQFRTFFFSRQSTAEVLN